VDVAVDVTSDDFCVEAPREDFEYSSCYTLAHEIDPKKARASFASGLMTLNLPFNVKENHVKSAPLKRNNLELIYFKIRNKSDLNLPDNRIWSEFPRGFTILDEDTVNELPAGTPLGTLQEEVPCKPLLYPDKPPKFKNLQVIRKE
jgi:hypothetical protein